MVKNEKEVRQEYRAELRILKSEYLIGSTTDWHRGYVAALRWTLRKRG